MDAEPGWERLAPAPFSTVCFRFRPAGVAEEEVDALNERILAPVNATGEVFLSHTRLRGRFVLRARHRQPAHHARRTCAAPGSC